jgi:hypothetical protein
MRPVEEELSDLPHSAVPDPPRDVSFDAIGARACSRRHRALDHATD